MNVKNEPSHFDVSLCEKASLCSPNKQNRVRTCNKKKLKFFYEIHLGTQTHFNNLNEVKVELRKWNLIMLISDALIRKTI